MAVFWIVLLIAILPFWLLQNVIHELAHGITIKFFGWKFSIYPFPSMKLGKFTFAHVIYEPTPSSRTPSNQGWALISIMPKIVNLLLFIISSTLSMVIGSLSPIVTALCVLFMACNLIDFSVGVAGIFRREPNQSDIWRFQSYIVADVYKMRWAIAIFIFLLWLFATIPVVFLLRM